MSVAATQRHKVFLQKRSVSGEQSRRMPVPVVLAAVARSPAQVTCSLCPDQFPGAKELGLHILAAHCHGGRLGAAVVDPVEEEDNLVIEGSPGESMEVQEDTSLTPLPLNLPRPPTQHEKKQKFVMHRINENTTRYICLVCDKMYTSRYNIRMHMNLHTGNNVHKCAFCAKTFGHKHVYESHVRTHTGERPFSCGKCSRKFGDRSNCSSHRKRCTGDAVLSPPDSPADRSYNIAPNVSITPIKKGTGGDMVTTVSPNQLVNVTFEPQIVSVTGAENMAELTNMGYDPDEDDNDSEEMMIEPDISLDYDDIEELMDENEEEGEEGGNKSILTAQKPVSSTIFTCSFCNVKYSQQAMLLEHLNTHLDIPSEPRQEDLEQGYMAIYYTSRPKFMCLSCGKLFATAESVNLHLNIHYEDKIYACEHCEKIFSHRHVYESHRKAAHGGEVSPQKKGPDYDCSYCGHAYPNLVSLDNHELACSARPVSITPLAVQEAEAARSPAIKISTPSAINSSVALNNNNNSNPDKPKKANRPPPMLILLNSDSSPGGQDDSFIMKKENMIKQEEVDEEDSDADWTEDCLKVKLPTLRPKPATALLSDEAKKIFANSAPQRRSSGGSNPRAHKIVETADGREYIPDTNSNNILHLEGIAPPPDNSERKKGYMLRPVGPGGQQRYICVECGKHYTTSYNVRMHRNIHIGKNLYTCKFCQKEFSHKHVWETHERVHTGERPFRCPTCPKDFADRSNYNSHKKICLRLQQQAFGSSLQL